MPILLSSMLHATWNIVVKSVGDSRGVLWVGQLAAVVCLFPVAWYFGPILPSSLMDARFLVVPGVIQAVYLALLSRAYRYGDISVVYPMARGCGVAVTALAAHFILGENLSASGIGGIIAVTVGMILLGMSKFSPEARGALKFALAIGLTLAAGGVNDKFAVSVLHPVVYMFWMFLLSSLVAAPIMLTRSRALVRKTIATHRPQVAIVGLGLMASYRAPTEVACAEVAKAI